MNTLDSSMAPAFGTARPRSTSRRVRAILAGGLVLGLGAAVTLAAWNDSEFASGSFAVGTFDLEGSASDGVSFGEHPVQGSPVALSFAATNVSPSSTYYAPFAVRLAANTSYGATVTMTNAATSGTLTGITYTVIDSGTWGCSGSTTGSTVVTAGTALGTVPGSTTFTLAQGVGAAAGAAKFLCFVVTTDSSLAQGQTATTTWQFTAQSTP